MSGSFNKIQVECLREQNNSCYDHLKEKSKKTIDKQCNNNPHFPIINEIRKPDFGQLQADAVNNKQLLGNHEEYPVTKTELGISKQARKGKKTLPWRPTAREIKINSPEVNKLYIKA